MNHTRDLVTAWFSSIHVSGVVFTESLDPVNDRYADYIVCYEAVFQPVDLDQARLEVWATTDGRIAIGFETRDRVAKRLGVRNMRGGFAAGHEPYSLTESAVRALLELVANGHIGIYASTVPWFGLGSTRAWALRQNLDALTPEQWESLDWLRAVTDCEFTKTGRVLSFRAWTCNDEE